MTELKVSAHSDQMITQSSIDNMFESLLPNGHIHIRLR
jgi:hypothetical protein